jgi:hypothetical protein
MQRLMEQLRTSEDVFAEIAGLLGMEREDYSRRVALERRRAACKRRVLGCVRLLHRQHSPSPSHVNPNPEPQPYPGP